MLEYLAIALIAIGIFLLVKGLTERVEIQIPEYREEEFEERERRKVEAGGVVLIGPIPIVFGSSRMAVLALILTIVLMLIVFLLFYV
ncbi:Protein of unknown function DUF131 [Ferroglobus placidus DSM 10642]|uniref:TIGR00304 family protein n=1 Tax=Ferroglobus placidus (strain DSM 10642 / AEDII12DO) TaxID=589924 RepID=D3RZ32_FERPA|nr:TIGR00304 family protein [Ferroglobus placidus]ADC65745.1 Protein of unknown function DUF131 [Ferroglobus placidus DSM 10642]